MFEKEQYSRKATMDVRSALSRALQIHLENIVFKKEGSQFKFTEVHDTWPSFTQQYIPPSACVLPGGWEYASWSLAPTLLEETWEPQGQMGFGLYKTDEVECRFEVSIRTDNPVERKVVMLGVEDSFQPPDMLMDEAGGARNSIIVPMTEYYDLPARFALLSGRVIDSEEQAMREQRVAVFTLSAQCSKVILGPVAPLSLTIVVKCMDDPNSCR